MNRITGDTTDAGATATGGASHPPPSLSFSLSPSAPPFSVDRPIARRTAASPTAAAVPYTPLYDWPHLASSGWDFVDAGEVYGAGLRDGLDAEFEPYSAPGVGSGDFGDEWNPRSRDLSWIDPRQFSTIHDGISPETFIVPEDSSSIHFGKDPTLLSAYYGGLESSEWFNENSVLSSHEHQKLFSNGSELKQSYFCLPGTSSTMGTCKTDRFTGQLSSHSTDSLIYNPSAVVSTQQQLSETSSGAILSPQFGKFKSGYSSVEHVNPYKTRNYFHCMPVGQTEPESTEMEQDLYRVRNNTTIDDTSIYSSTAIAGSSVHIDSANWNAKEKSSELKFGSRISGLNLSSPSITGYFSSGLDKSVPTYPTTLDQQNAVVDSPCWKGSSPYSHQFVVGNDVDHISVANDLEIFKHLDLDQKNTAVRTKSEEYSLFNKTHPAFSFTGTSSSVVSPRAYAKPEGVEIESSAKMQVSVRNSDSRDMTQEQNNGVGRQQCGYLELKKCGLKPSDNEKLSFQTDQAVIGVHNPHLDSATLTEDNLYDSTYASASYSGDRVTGTSHEIDLHLNNSKLFGFSNYPSKYSEGNTQLLVKAIHGLTEVLLSKSHGDVNMLKEHDIELVHLVIDNLRGFVFAADKMGFTRKSSHVSGIEASFAQADFSNIDEHANPKKSIGTTDNMHDEGLKYNSYKPDEFALGLGADYRRCMIKAVKEVAEDNHFEQDDSQSLLYKNLWIEAEVSLCTLKYELQAAYMKLEVERNMHQKELDGDIRHKSSQAVKLTGKKSMNPPDGYDKVNLMAKLGKCSKMKNEVQKGITDVAATSTAAASVAFVMDRFKILKGRFDNLNSDTLEEHLKSSDSINSKSSSERDETMQHKVKLDGLSDTNQKIPLLTEILGGLQYMDACDVYDKPIATANNNKCSKMKAHELDHDKTDKLDASVMARFEILKERIDNSSSDKIEEHLKF